jgi:hypothetical protein
MTEIYKQKINTDSSHLQSKVQGNTTKNNDMTFPSVVNSKQVAGSIIFYPANSQLSCIGDVSCAHSMSGKTS